MSKVAILYWEPGSCGDFVYSLLSANTHEYLSISDFSTVDKQGRVSPTISTFFKDNFEHHPEQWYLRTWTDDDVILLTNFIISTHHSIVVPTHRLDQAQFLQSQIADSIVIGITYPINMFPLVLKNWCKKVVPYDRELQRVYNQPIHEYFKNKNVFGEFVLSEQLKFGSIIKKSVGANFDLNISLEDIYNKNLSMLNSLFLDSSHVNSMFEHWFPQQSNIHQYQYNIPGILQQALGYNSTASYIDTLNIELDLFDNILIQHQNQQKSKKYFNTLQQAADFFKQ